MRRRDFIKVIGGTVAWPLAARAQQPSMPVVGVLSSRTPETDASVFGFFREGLKQSGFVEGQNAGLEYRWASGEYTRLPTTDRAPCPGNRYVRRIGHGRSGQVENRDNSHRFSCWQSRATRPRSESQSAQR
jgi:hypothetical protein